MSFEEFKQYVKDNIKDFLPKDFADAEVNIREVVKNNDMKLAGLMIKRPDESIVPTIYLDDMYRKTEDEGQPLDRVMTEIATLHIENRESRFDIENITDIDKAKDKIRMKLVNAERNEEYLKDKPHRIMEDLAVTYYVQLKSDEVGNASVAINENMMEQYGITEQELYEIASANMEMEAKPVFMDMNVMMKEIMKESLPVDMPDDVKESLVNDALIDASAPGIYVLSNEEKHFGAAMLLNEKAMDMVKETVGEDFFILPSSIHETIIVPRKEEFSLVEMEKMVREVNATQVSPEEQLSDHVYEYDAAERTIVRADKAEEKRLAKETEKTGHEPEKAAEKKNDGRVSFKEKLPEMKEKAAEQAKMSVPQALGKKKETALA